MKRHVLINISEYRGSWISVEDFLARYFLYRLFPTQDELHIFLNNHEAHPLTQFISSFNVFQNANKHGVNVSKQNLGNISFHIRCAYHLLQIDSANLLEARLVNRLKNTENFWGAMYEVFVRSYFINAGFSIELEDETDNSSSHCEFIARHPSGLCFDVEAKSKYRDFSLITENETIKPNISRLLKGALKKRAKNQRIIFANINMPSEKSLTFHTYWVSEVSRELSRLYGARKDGKSWPNAFFMFTNYPELSSHVINTVLGPELIGVEIGNNPAPPILHEDPQYIPLIHLKESFTKLSKLPRSFEDLVSPSIATWTSA